MERVKEDPSDQPETKQALNPDTCQVEYLVLYHQGLVLIGIRDKSSSTGASK